MKFLLDESADYPLAAVLANLGHDVTAVAHDYPASLKDPPILAIAYQEGRVLITNDTDFGELVFRRRLPHAGVILFRLGDESLAVKTAWLLYVLTHHVADLGHFVVVTDHGVRVRKSIGQ